MTDFLESSQNIPGMFRNVCKKCFQIFWSNKSSTDMSRNGVMYPDAIKKRKLTYANMFKIPRKINLLKCIYGSKCFRLEFLSSAVERMKIVIMEPQLRIPLKLLGTILHSGTWGISGGSLIGFQWYREAPVSVSYLYAWLLYIHHI